MGNSRDDAALIVATNYLVECINEGNEDAREDLAQELKRRASGNRRDEVDEVTARAMRANISAVEGLCGPLNILGPTTDFDELELATLGCQVQGLSMVGHLGELKSARR